MLHVLETDLALVPGLVGKASSLPKDRALPVLKMIKAGERMEDARPSGWACPVCRKKIVNHTFSSGDGRFSWSASSIHLLGTHGVWGPAHEELAGMLTAPVEMDFDAIDIDAMLSREERHPTSRDSGRPLRGDPPRSAGTDGRGSSRPPSHERRRRPMESEGRPPVDRDVLMAEEDYRNRQMPHPQEEAPGIFGAISSMFGGLFGGGGPVEEPPPLSRWFPDPGLQVRLVDQQGRAYGPGEVHPGAYMVEIYNGQSFAPLSPVDLFPGRSYAVTIVDNRVRWQEI